MSKQQCCGISKIFDEKEARKDIKSYHKKGPKKESAVLLNALKELGINDLSLLDIGGGVGVIQNELIKAGASGAVDVDASQAYINAAKEEALRQGHADKIEHKFGNFVEVAAEVEPADVVTLDKVLCCYDDVSALMITSLSKTRKYYALIYPHNSWWIYVGHWFAELGLLIRNTGFRSFIHPVKEIEERIASAGFNLVFRKKGFIWLVEIYVKK